MYSLVYAFLSPDKLKVSLPAANSAFKAKNFTPVAITAQFGIKDSRQEKEKIRGLV